jgi:DNA helicase-2/ATP-dependent DNA helicase PcrA
MIPWSIMAPDILTGLNKNQAAAVTHGSGPSLILAGAGSGKTKVLTHKVAYLIGEHRVDPTSILMVTFTNKAAEEMKNRIRLLLSGGQEGKSDAMPVSGTFHSLCARILRQSGAAMGLRPDFLIYDAGDQQDLVKQIMVKMDISQKNFHPGAILHTISEAKNELIGPTEYPQFARGYFQETVAKVYLAYQKELAEVGAMDFDDLIMATVRLFSRDEATLKQYQSRFRHVMVDEYQDTNHAQYTLSRMLAGGYRNITVVGDAAQSIYKFRGADFHNIVNFKNDYPDAKEFHLDRNYRSTQTILDAAYSVISHNQSHPILKLWTDKTTLDRIGIYDARSEHDEATFLVTTVLQSHRSYSDFAVLYRTNAQSRTIEEAFLRSGIPYTLVGGTRFYERKEIRDVLSYLRLLNHRKDQVSYARAEKIGKGRLERFIKFADDYAADQALIGLTTMELMDRILDVTRYLDLYDANDEEQAYRLENIKELRSVAAEYPDLTQFLETVALLEEDARPSKKAAARGNAVTLMTLHSAKGLEFPIVFMVGMEEGLFPHSRSLMDREELEEERRLCYVGITRAKEKLYLTYADKRLFFGTRTQNTVSRFIADIPEDILEKRISVDAGRGFRDDDLLI